MSVLKEFREFALKGNMVDLAIGVIIGAAFGGLVQSVVNDLLMPIIGLVTGGIDFSQMYVQLQRRARRDAGAARKDGATLAYGNFITLLINFLIVAWVLFMVVKAMNRMKRQPQPAPAVPPTPTREEVLLAEIRDLLRARASGARSGRVIGRTTICDRLIARFAVPFLGAAMSADGQTIMQATGTCRRPSRRGARRAGKRHRRGLQLWPRQGRD